MNLSRLALSRVYVLIGIAAWVLTSLHLPSYFSQGFIGGTELFWKDALFAGTAAGKFLTVDIFMLAMAALIWLIVEARTRAMRGVSIYILVALLVGISLAFPLFLAARERHILRAEPGNTHLTLHKSDMLWVTALVGLSLAGSLLTLL